MSDLIDFIKELKTEVEQNDSTYVYYEKENGNIVSISSSFDESLLEDQEVIKVSQKQALPLLIGDKKTSDYIVIYDIAQKQKVLKLKNYQDLNKEAGDMCHKLPNVRKNNSGHVSCEEIYEGMDVFFWQKTLSYKKDDIVWYKNNVYKLLESNYKGRGFSLKKSQLIVPDVYITDIPTQEMTITKFVHSKEYLGIHVDVWYDSLDHVKGQHVWFENNVYKMINDQSSHTCFDSKNVELVISGVILFNDVNPDLDFNRVLGDGDTYLDNNQLYSARLETMSYSKQKNISAKDILFKADKNNLLLWRYQTKTTMLVDSTKNTKSMTEGNELELYDSLNLKNGEKILLGSKLYSIGSNKDYDIIITQNLPDKNWVLSLNPSTLKFFQLSNYGQDDMLYFSITSKHDPNILYRSLQIPLSQLRQKVILPMIYDDELEDLSIFTTKYFTAYGHEVVT